MIVKEQSLVTAPASPALSHLRTLANGLTVCRGLLAVPLLLVLQGGWAWWAWWLLVGGATTDAVDGWLARWGGGGSLWGARLDPLCDKLLLLAPLLWLAGRSAGPTDTAISAVPTPLWAIWLLLARELLVTEWRSRHPHGAPAHWSGKLKTLTQLLCFGFLLWPGPAQALTAAVGGGLFWVALAMAWLSGIHYIQSSRS